MAKSCIGAWIRYCGHNGCFIADIYEIGNVNVVNAGAPVLPEHLERELPATHHMVDFPVAGFWKPLKGIFVIPQEQVKEL